MKTISLLASTLALAVTVAAAPAPEFDRRNYFCLQSFEAQLIVNKYISILENKSYLGQSPSSTANQVIAADYVEYSDSILSLEKAAFGNTPSATSLQQWFSEVTTHPEVGVQTLNILNSCTQIMWHWNFPSVSGGQYEVKGFNLLSLDNTGKIARADIEFNSIAWGLDTQQLYEWCPSS